MNGLLPSFSTCSITIEATTIDEKNMKAVFLLYFYMVVKGKGGVKERTVRNDIVWLLYFSGDGKLVERAMEWVDKGASERIRELVVKGREEGVIEKVGEEGEWRPFK